MLWKTWSLMYMLTALGVYYDCGCFLRCEYYYDAFGNLDQKNCSTGSYRYLVDPFGIFGGDIIAEVRKKTSKPAIVTPLYIF